MNLIFLYGPPAVGKLTVAKELAKQTGFKLFHNHLSYDLGRELFEYSDPRIWVLVEQLRLFVIETAASQPDIRGMIFTNVWTKTDLPFVSNVVEVVKKHAGQVLFVKLTCDQDELLKRVASESRTGSKLKDPEVLKKALVEADFTTPVPYPENITLDTTFDKPEQVAQKIVEHFHL